MKHTALKRSSKPMGRSRMRAVGKKRSKTFPDGRERLNVLDWRQRRREVWERDGGECRGCGRKFGLRDCHVHHVQHRSVRRDDRAANLILLCPSCHFRLHEEERTL
jgi:5-methylcytosine-specific restriction enzyme A